MIRIIAAVLGACLLMLPLSAQAAVTETIIEREETENTESELMKMLETIPSQAFASKYISYLDLHTLLENYPSLERPSVDIKPGESRDAEQMWRKINSFMMRGVAAGPFNFLMKYHQNEDVYEKSGLNLFGIERMLDIGMPPDQQLWLEGQIDAELLTALLTSRGYQQNDLMEEKPFVIMSPEGDLSIGTDIDLENADSSFVFGGQLGQRWPILFNEDRIMSAPSGAAVKAAANVETGDSVADIPEVNDLIYDMSNTPEGNLPLTQMYIFDAAFSLSDSDLSSLVQGQLVGVAELFYDDAQYIHLSLTFNDEAEAEAHARSIKKKLEDDIKLMIGRPLQDALKGMDAVIEAIRVNKGENGTVILTLPVRSTIQEPSHQMRRTPLNLFRQMILTRDLDWFLVSDTTP